jgi:hypothetical protein
VVADTAAKNAGGILAQRAMLERQMRNNALAAFWSSAFMPASPDALVQVAMVALGGLQPNVSGVESAEQLNGALSARARAAASALALRGDARGAAVKAEIDDAERRATSRGGEAQQKQQKEAYKMIGLALGMLALLLAIPTLFKHDKAESDPQPDPTPVVPAATSPEPAASLYGSDVPSAFHGKWNMVDNEEGVPVNLEISATRVTLNYDKLHVEFLTSAPKTEPKSGDKGWFYTHVEADGGKSCDLKLRLDDSGRLRSPFGGSEGCTTLPSVWVRP